MPVKSLEDDIDVIFKKVQKLVGRKFPVRVELKGMRVHDEPHREEPIGSHTTKVTGLRIIGEAGNREVEIIFKDKVWGSNRHQISLISNGHIRFDLPDQRQGQFNEAYFTIHLK